MFRSEEQRSEVVRVMLRSLRLQRFWNDGPTDAAIALLEADGGGLSSGERVLFLAAWDVWNGDGKATLAQIMYKLDCPRIRLLGTFLIAVSEGGNAIDRWLEEHEAPNATRASMDGSVEGVEHVS